MHKTILFIFFCCSCWSQKLHHQVISAQGANLKIANGMFVSQSIGQVNSSIGNFKNPKLIIGQGYIQSFAIASTSVPTQKSVTVIVYPNPVYEIVNFKFSSPIGTSTTLYLFDSRGRLVFSQRDEFIQDILSVNVSSLSEGVYFAKITSSIYTFSTKIIKSK
ncbi:T9SS type A sorting domain-containing protein [Flavobacterium sp.]|uniref:T9SS type A sorting domain-containing protein n=1 Tax=Flavobacterium sp. TaxID=239 RepID=UPI00286F42E5|nr:T9SS type A sorting domain-containing protein [Flavobacterium sp.]